MATASNTSSATSSALTDVVASTRVETRRRISPYDLTSGDNPGTLISKPLLRGPNYDEWANNLRLALKARKKFGFADGSIPQPEETSPDFEDWIANNALVVSWIKLTIDESLSSSLSHTDDSHELWTHIQKRFGVKNGQRVQRLKTELANCRQKGLAIEAYYGKLTQLWRSLADYQQAKTMEEIRKEREEDKLHQFLMGLDDSLYGPIKSALLSRVPLPTLEEAYNSLTQDEESKLLGRLNDERSDGMSFAVQTSAPRNFSDYKGGKITCSNCGRTGHVAENCFRRIGYPEWWGEGKPPRNKTGNNSFKGNQNSGGAVRSMTTQSAGSTMSKGHEPVRANHVLTTTQSAASGFGFNVAALPNTAPLTDADRVGISGLSDPDWKLLQHMLAERKATSPQQLSGKYFFESWVIDTGASNHMTGTLEFLIDVCEMAPILIKLPDGRYTSSTKHGRVVLGSSLRLQEVLFVDGLKCHLISVSQLTRDRGCVFQITDRLCIVQDRITRTLIGAGEQENGLYFFRGVDTQMAIVQAMESLPADVWHRRLGHPSSKALEMLNFSKFSSGSFDSKACDICIHAKQTRDSFPLSSNKTTFPFELVHCDLWGPYRTSSICGSRYFLTILDDYSRAVWIYLLPSKKDAPTHLKNFLALVERQFSAKVKTIRSDNGSEFICLSDYFMDNGIIHETSCVGTPQQNGRVERKHRHILNVARALMFQADLPIEFWGYCALTAGYLINRTPTTILNGKTPFELIYNRPPPLNHLRVFGSLCYVHNQKHGGDKFARRSMKSVFLGYPFGKKGWRVYNIETGRISVSRDVIFSELEFPFADPSLSSLFSSPETSSSPTTPDDLDDFSHALVAPSPNTTLSPSQNEITISQPATTTLQPVIESPTDQSSSEVLSSTDQSSSDDEQPSDSEMAIIPSSPANLSSDAPVYGPEPEPLGVGLRPKKLPTRLSDYVLMMLQNPPPTNTPYPLDNYVSNSQFSTTYQAYLTAISSGHEPQHYNEAVLDENWRFAVKDEIVALEDNGTWTVESLPPGKKALGCKWVFRLKFNADGTLERHKARLVVLGNHQTEGIDYEETFAPVAKMITVRAFFQQAASLDWEVHQMDVHNAFLHGDLTEEVYMQFPPGFRTDDKSKVCRLRKSLYGLKQAPRCWFAKLGAALKNFGFEQDMSDYSLFILATTSTRLHVLVYVDDLIITGSSLHVVNEFKAYLSTCFHMKNLGLLRYFLGIEVARSPTGIYLCQRKYALEIISETGILGAKPKAFPLAQHHKLALATGDLMSEPSRYRRLIGRLIYLGNTRPELSYVIHILAQFMNAPKQDHWEAALRVVCYLKHSPGQGILLKANTPLILNAWCDADHAACPVTSRSLTGWFIQLGDSPLSWKTRKQDVVSRSSCEAEYRAMADTVQELLWLRELLPALGIECSAPITLNSDSLSAISLALNPVFHARTKHVGKDVHFIRDEIIRGVIVPKHVHTTSQLADIMTKALGRKEFEEFLVKLGVCNLHTPP
ncbi:GAG-pre-integrase domain [Arabidopsis thaliana x Arabidopsis arenosa]|uniref:GAG-pre-integrase domain n=1 Tax=Arabidopsis thaliana x Arabidopsis arenosa TaxID=1240361 RepID=A0A8T2BCI6_9BRAS|nr:GAG-pre-integrase domain [Arabidopsis thaliana x Arabidopsis arenosa]